MLFLKILSKLMKYYLTLPNIAKYMERNWQISGFTNGLQGTVPTAPPPEKLLLFIWGIINIFL